MSKKKQSSIFKFLTKKAKVDDNVLDEEDNVVVEIDLTDSASTSMIPSEDLVDISFKKSK